MLGLVRSPFQPLLNADRVAVVSSFVSVATVSVFDSAVESCLPFSRCVYVGRTFVFRDPFQCGTQSRYFSRKVADCLIARSASGSDWFFDYFWDDVC